MAISQTQMVLEQLKSLGERMDDGFHNLDERLRALEINDGKNHKAVDMNMDAAWTRIDNHTTRLQEAEERIEKIGVKVRMLNSIAKWLLGIFTALLTASLTLFITGHAQIIIK